MDITYADEGITLQWLIDFAKEKGFEPNKVKLLTCGVETVTVVAFKENNRILLDCETLLEEDFE